MIGDEEKFGISNLSSSGNGSNLDPFQWRGCCDKYRKKVMRGSGIFCGNLYVWCRQYTQCQRVWCGGCYIEHPKDDFPKSGKELEGYWEGELEGRYEKSRTGDNLITHFQCDLCHFRNMKGIELDKGSEKDKKLVISIRRASLDEFWSREPGTVRGNLTMLRDMVKMAKEEIGLEDWLPPLGP